MPEKFNSKFRKNILKGFNYANSYKDISRFLITKSSFFSLKEAWNSFMKFCDPIEICILNDFTKKTSIDI